VKHRFSLDRFEGTDPELAVLLTSDGTEITLPREMLPHGCRPGEILSCTLQRDLQATQKLAEETRALQARLKKTDPGGDITL